MLLVPVRKRDVEMKWLLVCFVYSGTKDKWYKWDPVLIEKVLLFEIHLRAPAYNKVEIRAGNGMDSEEFLKQTKRSAGKINASKKQTIISFIL